MVLMTVVASVREPYCVLLAVRLAGRLLEAVDIETSKKKAFKKLR